MKAVQVIYLFAFLGIIVYIIKSTHLLEGYQDSEPASPLLGKSDPVIPQGLKQDNLDTPVKPNPDQPGSIPFGPYGQSASVGSYQFKDPAQIPAAAKQIKQLYEDVKTFLVFEGVSISDSSDPNVSLPLTQLRADLERLQQELSVTERNPGVESTLTQQDLANIQGGLTFLQRKVRLFQTAGVISDSDGKEGFMGAPPPRSKLRATKAELQILSTKITAAILILSASGTTDIVVKARITNLQKMYSDISEMIRKLNNGIWTQQDVPVFSEDIKKIIPNLANINSKLPDINKASDAGYKLNPLEKQIAGLVGEENAKEVFNKLKDRGMFRVTLDVGYNIPGSAANTKNTVNIKKDIGIKKDGSFGLMDGDSIKASPSLSVDGPYDSTMSGADDRASAGYAENSMGGKPNNPSHLDWKARAKGICKQIKARGMDPLDFGCIPEESKLSPAYSWRGHTKMVCGRLASTMDPTLPQTCGCPPPNWKGWTLPACLSPPAGSMGSLSKNACIV
jgi:hypothetical protein